MGKSPIYRPISTDRELFYQTYPIRVAVKVAAFIINKSGG